MPNRILSISKEVNKLKIAPLPEVYSSSSSLSSLDIICSSDFKSLIFKLRLVFRSSTFLTLSTNSSLLIAIENADSSVSFNYNL
ncbi:hypothetical protein BpHYR1_006489 [Brachionus plicatilis]|uniref:Uncharacterized protein n=1 Tax=Brachionus plicatilis TaxID=10195 RepID=A0A3M7R088_BRAPC|nr:hypothetical protein BpHYR1_006489 [Brachionus plicatilis]